MSDSSPECEPPRPLHVQNQDVDELNLLLHEAIRNFNETPEPEDPPTELEDDPGPFSLESFEAFSRNAREDISNAYGWLMAQLPFMFLFVVLLICDFLDVFLVYTFNTFLLYAVSFKVKNQLAMKSERSLVVGFLCLFSLGTQIVATAKYYSEYNLVAKLAFLPYTGSPTSTSFLFITFWIVATNDLLVRIGTMAFKCLINLVFGNNPNFKRREHVYSITDTVFHMYRALLPMPMWSAYLLSESHGVLVSRLLFIIYVLVKLSKLKRQLRKTITILTAHYAGHGRYGKYSTPSEISQCGNVCSICHDPFHMPTTLSCRHVFCEDCVSGWFVHEKTCPLCRTTIHNAGTGLPSLFTSPSALGLRHYPVEIF